MSTVQNTCSQSNPNPAPRGGQYNVGPFGYRSFTEAQPAAPSTPRRADDQPRRLGGLSYAQRGLVFRAKMAAAAVLARKGQEPAPAAVAPTGAKLPAVAPIGAKSDRTKQAAAVAKAFAHICRAKPIRPGWTDAEYDQWADERFQESVAYQARQMDAATDEYEGAGLAATLTPAMQRAADASEQQDARDWNNLADLAATPEWDRTLPFGGVETTCALD